MARRKTEHLTPLELEIMHVLWATGPANVQSVQQHLERELAYTTVQTMLNILHKKAKVKRVLKDRAYEYAPVVSRSQVTRQHITDLIDRLFGGSAESLVVSLVETKHLTPKKLARLQKLIKEQEEKEKAALDAAALEGKEENEKLTSVSKSESDGEHDVVSEKNII